MFPVPNRNSERRGGRMHEAELSDDRAGLPARTDRELETLFVSLIATDGSRRGLTAVAAVRVVGLYLATMGALKVVWPTQIRTAIGALPEVGASVLGVLETALGGCLIVVPGSRAALTAAGTVLGLFCANALLQPLRASSCGCAGAILPLRNDVAAATAGAALMIISLSARRAGSCASEDSRNAHP